MAERIIHPTSPEEAARIDRLADLAEQDRDDLVQRQQLRAIAAREESFKGEVLRALADVDLRITELADLTGVDVVTFDDFRCGLYELPLPAFERLARRLGFALSRVSGPAMVTS